MIEIRMVDLETRFAHLENFIEQLNAVVTDQQKTIERLQKEISDVKHNSNVDMGISSTRSLKDDKPPHY